MPPGKFSHILLMIGLLVGVVAVWASAPPVVGGTDRIVGGWWYDTLADGEWVATSWAGCTVCAGTFAGSCTDYGVSYNGNRGCSGGYASVAYSVEVGYPGSATVHASGLSPCWSTANLYCNDLYDADCY